MFLNPEQILIHLELTPGQTVADFGCGSGHYAILAAKRVGANGKVYAFDVIKEALEALRSRAELERLRNIETIRANVEQPGGSKLKDASAHAAILSNILFQAENKPGLLAEAKRILKPGGRALVIEWNQAKSIGGPALAARLTREEILRLFEATGMPLEKEFSAGDQHFGFIFRNP
ncbi:MAG: class I SAM-dependent methyltransferase [Candidatus Niyogibacteria bacterium]|nr:class I SAM-dependent methyltransferase [Candidatus Niyogibacteria bacterium]